MIKGIKFEARADWDGSDESSLFYIVSKRRLNGRYPKADHATVELRVRRQGFNQDIIVYADISPTKYDLDYAWKSLNLSEEELHSLLMVASHSRFGNPFAKTFNCNNWRRRHKMQTLRRVQLYKDVKLPNIRY